MIIDQVNFGDFCDRWVAFDRKDSFSYHGKLALFDYLEQLSDDIGEPIELDIVALDCEFMEYDNLEAVQEVYPDIKDLKDLYDHTTVIEIPDYKDLDGVVHTGGLIVGEF